ILFDAMIETIRNEDGVCEMRIDIRRSVKLVMIGAKAACHAEAVAIRRNLDHDIPRRFDNEYVPKLVDAHRGRIVEIAKLFYDDDLAGNRQRAHGAMRDSRTTRKQEKENPAEQLHTKTEAYNSVSHGVRSDRNTIRTAPDSDC